MLFAVSRNYLKMQDAWVAANVLCPQIFDSTNNYKIFDVTTNKLFAEEVIQKL